MTAEVVDPATGEVIVTNVADLSIERLVHIDQRIDAHEGEALRDRWEFGRLLGGERGDKKKLPPGRLADVCRETGKSRAEVQFRMQFAEEYDEERLSSALDNRLSWHEVIRSGLGDRAALELIVTKPQMVPEGQFGTIVADPPWEYGNTSTRGAAEDHYDTLAIAQLTGEEPLPSGENLADIVRGKAASQSHLYLWTTAGHLPAAFRVMDAWGFEYKTYLVWVKPQMGMGNYFRVSTELVLFGTRGGLRTSERDIKNYFEARRGKHSTKPLVFQDTVAKTSPAPYLEMFTRCYADQMITGCTCSKCRLGWETWGNQA